MAADIAGARARRFFGKMTAFRSLKASGLSRLYLGKDGVAHTALDDVAIALDPGALIGIVGESGSGKSTLTRILLGLIAPSRGVVTFNDVDLPTVLARAETRLAFRRIVQSVSQDTSSSFDPLRTLRQSARAPAIRLSGLGRRQADAKLDDLLERLSLPVALADRYPQEISGGERQRFAIARAMIVDPEFVICDEAVSALDVSIQGSILNMLKAYCRERGAGLLFVSHNLPAAAFIADRLIVMNRGKIVETGSSVDIVRHPRHPYTAELIAAFGGAVPAGSRSFCESRR
jgi:peptide/nickel transport system ATP-binding protein